MTVTINGTTGIQNPLGSAAAPSESNTTNSNTGAYFPTGTTYGIATNGSNAMYIDASQNVGIGTTSPSGNGKLAVVGASSSTLGYFGTATNASARFYAVDGGETDLLLGATGGTHTVAQIIAQQAIPMTFFTSNAERMRIDSSGNVGIGVTGPAGKLDILTGTNRGYFDDSGTSFFRLNAVNAVNSAYNPLALNGSVVTVQTGATERMRIDASGNLLVGTTDAGTGSGPGFKILSSTTTASCGNVMNTASSINSYHLYNTNATNNGYRFYVNVNGGIYNYSANNSNLSDRRLKKDIQLAGPYLDKICAIPVKTFLYNDQSDGEFNLGVIAQDVEAVAPELVNKDGWEVQAPEGEEPYKSIYQTDLQYALMKAIQEQQAIIQELSAEVTALKAKVGA